MISSCEKGLGAQQETTGPHKTPPPPPAGISHSFPSKLMFFSLNLNLTVERCQLNLKNSPEPHSTSEQR